MVRKNFALISLVVVVLLGLLALFYFLTKGSPPPPLATVKAARHDIKVAVSTNGIIEPLDRDEIYAPIDGFVARIPKPEGSEIAKGQLILQLESEQIRTALAEARAALLRGKREARTVMTGPPREEVAALDASIAECEMQLSQTEKDLKVEESLFSKGAASRAAVENLQKQRAQTQVRAEGLKKRKLELEQRYSAEDKELEQGKVAELAKQVSLLEQQLQMGSVLATKRGLIYSIPVKPGSYVRKGDLLAQTYQPGRIRLRAYVDEPDLGRVQKGQPVRVEWDGLPNRQWTGVVDKPAEQVVALNNRSVGYVFCSVDAGPRELIPNLNVKVEITTAHKADVLVVPRSAVIQRDGKPSVLVSEGGRTVVRPVELGLVTSEEIEIMRGISDGDSVAVNPSEAKLNP
jgi:HlyD family secretion protein